MSASLLTLRSRTVLHPSAMDLRDQNGFGSRHVSIPQSLHKVPRSKLGLKIPELTFFLRNSDAFALNMGTDVWEPTQMQHAYNAAQQSGTPFKLFISFDMTALPCGDTSLISSTIAQFAHHPSQLKDAEGAAFVSTFQGGAGCMNNAQWTQAVKGGGVNTRFIPAFTDDLTNEKMKSMYPCINGDFLVRWRFTYECLQSIFDR